MKRIRDYGINIGTLPTGKRNEITDVEGVKVGHETISSGEVQTGVTAIIPANDNLFQNKLIAASHVFNGFGKTTGLVQLNELGTLETPILLTNTLSVGTCTTALVRYMLEQDETIGNTTGTVNPVVGECNDMVLNNIRSLQLSEEDAFKALQSAQEEVVEGSVGAGRGMKCFGLKGGIGTSSRKLTYEHGDYTFGILVLSNFGKLEEFRLNGKQVGMQLKDQFNSEIDETDKGSIMMIVATDLPVTSQQLKRIVKRTGNGLSRTGSFMGNGSGDVAIGYSTANRVPHSSSVTQMSVVHENDLDQAFQAVADATEEAILNSMVMAEAVTGRNEITLHSLSNYIEGII
ncbi:DmpA family aminopeptidase [Alkalibacillus haloalkaliphilus]|uniref:Aminopeptidase n=1 Tax=Alkalibacillus haloalkaliphilus TaxID=94136 RepID=A0A511W5E8_9BACI|nr:P1 family peptidase [Alkalibacillus haloalkaliphilus]GEN46329.1 aminopeptidase [Alkalibacillus haloalkaliphilus]